MPKSSGLKTALSPIFPPFDGHVYAMFNLTCLRLVDLHLPHWLVVWNIFYFYIGNSNPNWLICFRGVGQPPTSPLFLRVLKSCWNKFKSHGEATRFSVSPSPTGLSGLISNTFTRTGWWFGTFGLCFHILGMSSSQLTKSYFSEG